MRKRIIELEMENAHPKKGGDYLRQKRLARYRFIESQKVAFPIKLLCRVMKVNRSVYYAYAKRWTYRKTDCAAAIKECFDFNSRRYGSRGIAAELQIERATVRKVMRREGLRVIQLRSFKPQTNDSKHGLPICANLLQNGANAPVGKGEVIVGDITYLRLRNGGFCYLACLQDKFTRRIVGWKVAERMTAPPVIDVFLQARRRGLIGKGAIIDSDRGSQYAAVEYRRLLYINGFRESMSLNVSFLYHFLCCLCMRFAKIATNERGLAIVVELAFRPPVTEVDNCNVADVLFINQIYNVQPELKHNSEQMLRLTISSPNNAKPNVVCSFFCLTILIVPFSLWGFAELRVLHIKESYCNRD